MVSPELTSNNYGSWSRSFLLALSIRNKVGFVDGSIKEPALEDPMRLSWTRCNNLIIAWLLRSISPPIASTVFYITSAAKMWEILKKRFAQPDESRICNLQLNLCTITQGGKSVDAYFTELSGLLEELRNYRPLPHCQCGGCNVECFQKFVNQQQKDYVFKFINGLNDSFSALRSQVVVMRPFPSLDEVYNMALREESQRNFYVMPQPLTDATAMAAFNGNRRKGRSDITCSFCGKNGHLREKCYRLIGFPPNFKFTKSAGGSHSSANSVSQVAVEVSTENSGSQGMNLTLNNDQVQRLMTLLNDHNAQPLTISDKSSNPSSSKTTETPSVVSNLAGPIYMDSDWIC